MHARQQAVGGEALEVGADRHLGEPELAGELGRPHEAASTDQVGDAIAPTLARQLRIVRVGVHGSSFVCFQVLSQMQIT
nr:hypothetical protein GCM10025699_65730 [Microbacterium flavescens]